MSYTLLDNAEKKQYEFHVDGQTPKIEYIKTKDKIYLTHTEVPKGLEGKGIGTELIRQALNDIKEKELTLVPLCPFVALFLKRNTEYKQLVLKGITIE